MDERNSKTIICSIFFLDIVEYSKKSVAGQISLKERFNTFLSNAITGVPATDRIILDTGDGAAVSFLGDVEDAMRASLSMRASLLSDAGVTDPPLLVRMGVNLGPVRLVKDINGQPNIVGDGINVAQRVMGFAEPGQILVSRSYFDAASRLSQEYAGMFHFQGSKTDKHVREHEVYAIGYPGDLDRNYQKVNAGSNDPFGATTGKLLAAGSAESSGFSARLANIVDVFKSGTTKQKAIYAGLFAIPVLLLMLVVKFAIKQSAVPVAAPTQVAVEASTGLVGTEKTPSLKVNETANAKLSLEDKSKAAVKKEVLKKDAKEKKEVKDKKDKKNASASKKTTDETKGGLGVVALNVKPWGEIYLDGKMVNVSPPMTKLNVPAGDHVLEIKNTTFPSYKQSIKMKAGGKLAVAHKFTN
jgi:hypothetical protein